MRRLVRTSDDKIIAGVLGGVASFFGLQSFYVRVGFTILIFFSFGACILLYLLACFIIPSDWEVR